MFAKKGFAFWYKAARPLSFGQSITPYLLGAILGVSTIIYSGTSLYFANPEGIAAGVGLKNAVGPLADAAANIAMLSTIFSALTAGLAGLAGVIFAHAGMNLLDDYFDMKKGAVERREQLLDGGFRARLGKCGYLKDGSVSLTDTKKAALSFIAIALVLAAICFAIRGWETLIFAGLALLLGVFYAGPPLRLSYRGFGELVIGLLFGPVLVTAASFLVSGQITTLALFCSIPIGLLVSNIVMIHAVMDYGPDLASHRKTLPILLGSERSGVIVSVLMVIAAQLIILAGIFLGYLPIATLLVVLTYPLSFVFIKLALSYCASTKSSSEAHDSFQPQRWMGNYGNWAGFQQQGLDWFMSRWLTARNLIMQFSVILGLAILTPWYF